jgi:hypothetical protein
LALSGHAEGFRAQAAESSVLQKRDTKNARRRQRPRFRSSFSNSRRREQARRGKCPVLARISYKYEIMCKSEDWLAGAPGFEPRNVDYISIKHPFPDDHMCALTNRPLKLATQCHRQGAIHTAAESEPLPGR